MREKYILLAENDSNDVALTIKAFEKCQIRNKLVVVSNGPEALSYLMSPDLLDKPAIVILDLKLPLVGGFEILRQIRADQNTRHLPVYILTASSDENDRQKSIELGANGYECKPIRFNDFVNLLQQMCEQYLR